MPLAVVKGETSGMSSSNQIFFLIVSLNLVFCDDNVAMESDVNYQVSYKVHPEPETVQITHDYGKDVLDGSTTSHQNHIQINFQKYKYENQIANSNNPRYNQASNEQLQISQPELSQSNHLVQSVPHEIYPQQETYVQQHPQQIHILGAVAAPLTHTEDDSQKTLGFSSYVEHVTKKEEEEIQSALKEGSVNDIKRLVPKSGVSFKIYHNDKKVIPVKTQLGTHHNVLVQNQGHQEPQHDTRLHTLNVLPAAPVKYQTIQTEIQHQNTATIAPHPIYVKNQIQQQPLVNPHQLLHIVRPNIQEHQSNAYDAQVEGTSNKQSLVEIGGQTAINHPNYRIKTNHGKATSEIQFSSNLDSAGKSLKSSAAYKKEVIRPQYNQFNAQRQSRPEALAAERPKFVNQENGAVQQVKAIQYEINTNIPSQPSKNFQNDQYEAHSQLDIGALMSGKNYANQISTNQQGVTDTAHATPSSYISTNTAKSVSGYVNQAAENLNSQNNYVQHTTATPYVSISDTNIRQPLRPTDSSKNIIPVTTTKFPNLFVKAQENLQNQENHFQVTTGDVGFEKQIQSISHLPINTYIDAESTKFGQGSFDHQKALEGSTSFDIQNAISGTDALHQNLVTPTPEVFRQSPYLIPKIPISPTPFSLTANHIHGASFGKGHENLIHSSVVPTHGFSYPAVSFPLVTDVNGKFFSQPQTISLWNDHLKQGNTLAANDLHQSLVRLHLPKDVPHLKTNIEIPVGFVPHQKPITFFQEQPVIKYSHDYQQHKAPSMQSIRIAHPKPEITQLKMPTLNINSILLKPEMMSFMQEPGKKVIPILVKKRKTRHNKDIGVIYGKITANGPLRPNHRLEKAVRSQPSNVKIANGDRKNEFSVSASYKVDRSS